MRQISIHATEPTSPSSPRFSLAEVRQLIALMNTNDLNEITIERPEAGTRLALRKTTLEVNVQVNGTAVALPAATTALPPVVAPPAAPETPAYAYVTAPLVGTYHPALKAGQKPLVTVGDSVREGQIIGGIETLRVMNEVEAHMNGRVVEILVQPGQPVEYGQRLIALAPETR
ncbi:MAG: acetyl-CoA carboxylase, biotin carboxyl carrier protein [Ktedonobacterales bacterium]|nr:acetyl-CoA carboxylase, biotin carboxyl carrier protein [Ktedonobacterales bacterium]